MPAWLKWVSIVVILITTILVPVLLFEDESNALVEGIIAWTDNEPLLTALVVITALTSDVLFPVPNGVVNTAAGSLFGWGAGSVVIWMGLTLGCLLGYAFGTFAGQPLARRFVGAEDLARAHDFAERMGDVTLVVTRTVPMFGDIATLAAGMTAYPFRRYLVITGLANAGVAVVFAWIGAQATEGESVWLGMLGAIALPLAAFVLFRLFHRNPDKEVKNLKQEEE